MTLFDRNGASLITDDDGAGNFDARIFNYRLPYTGYYQIQASSYNTTFGNYGLSIWKADSLQTISTLNQIYEGNITRGRNQVWVFNAQANMYLTITASAVENNLDTFIILWNSSGQALGVNDDIIRGDITDSQLDIILPTTDTYYLEVRDFDNLKQGRYDVMIQLYNTNRPMITNVTREGGCDNFDVIVNVTDNQNDLSHVEMLKRDEDDVILEVVTRLDGNHYRVTSARWSWSCTSETCTDYLQAVDDAGNRSNIYEMTVECNG